MDDKQVERWGAGKVSKPTHQSVRVVIEYDVPRGSSGAENKERAKAAAVVLAGGTDRLKLVTYEIVKG